MKETKTYCDLCKEPIKGNLGYEEVFPFKHYLFDRVRIQIAPILADFDDCKPKQDADLCEDCQKGLIIRWANFLREQK